MELSFGDWQNVDLRVGLIEKAEHIEGKSKLYKLTVSFGAEKRTAVAGIKPYYSIEGLEGKKAVFVFNLAPATIAGLQSTAMILAVQTADKTYKAIFVDDAVKEGARLE
ncbi:MAG: methionine--tRNA ligase [Candidatus Diapherotrites archaeon]|nr:methionine--tRNA ligase [Candidatus Diapherotrites archaeon]